MFNKSKPKQDYLYHDYRAKNLSKEVVSELDLQKIITDLKLELMLLELGLKAGKDSQESYLERLWYLQDELKYYEEELRLTLIKELKKDPNAYTQ